MLNHPRLGLIESKRVFRNLHFETILRTIDFFTSCLFSEFFNDILSTYFRFQLVVKRSFCFVVVGDRCFFRLQRKRRIHPKFEVTFIQIRKLKERFQLRPQNSTFRHVVHVRPARNSLDPSNEVRSVQAWGTRESQTLLFREPNQAWNENHFQSKH